YRGAAAEQQRVADREPERHGKRPGPPRRGGHDAAVDRQRRNRHQVIAAKAMQKAERERGHQQQHAAVIIASDPGQSSRTPWLRTRKYTDTARISRRFTCRTAGADVRLAA